MTKLILFDMDKILVKSTGKIEDQLNTLIDLHKKGYDLGILSSSTYEKIKNQLNTYDNEKIFKYIFTENGTTLHQSGVNIYKMFLDSILEEKNIQKIINTVLLYISELNIPHKRGNFIDFRNSSLYVSPVGNNCSLEIRKKFIEYDNKYKIREKMIIYLRKELKDLNLEIYLGNTIGIHILPKGWNKTFCLDFLNTHNYTNIFFFGDKCRMGGNDYHIFNSPKIIGFEVELFPNKKIFNNFKNILKRIFYDHTIPFEDLLYKKNMSLDWNLINPYLDNDILNHNNLFDDKCDFNKIAIVKLNGGLGTTMKCKGPKSIIKVKNNLSFLEITINQIRYINKKYNCNIPLILMNSVFTDLNPEMNAIINNNNDIKILIINQPIYPRIDVKTNKPMTFFSNDISSYAPSGTGTFYETLLKSDIYFDLIKNNIQHLFISNIDNLSATLCPKILNYMQTNPKIDITIEVTPKTNADVKGGTFIKYEGKTKLLELAMVPKENLEEFYSIEKFKIFNTNNIWLNTNSLIKEINIEYLKNYKNINGRDIYQLESIIGSVIDDFENNKIICVNRDRFSPVKKICNLEEIRSDKYYLDDQYNLKKK